MKKNGNKIKMSQSVESKLGCKMKSFALSEASIAFDFISCRQGTIIIADSIEFHITKIFNFLYARKTKKHKREGARAIIASKLSFDAHENGKKNKSAEMRYVKVW